MTIRTFLAQPFDYFEQAKHQWVYIISATLFLMFFIIIYEPFGLSRMAHEPSMHISAWLGFILIEGFMAFSVLCISQFVIQKHFPKQSHTVRRSIAVFLAEVLVIVIALFAFKELVVNVDHDEATHNHHNLMHSLITNDGIVGFLFLYFAHVFILSYAFIGSLVFLHIKKIHHELSELEQLIDSLQNKYNDTSENTLDILDENGKVELTIDLRELLFIESDNQYINVHFKQAEKLTKRVVRTRMKKVLTELHAHPIFRCHRSYAVNMVHVHHLEVFEQKTYLILDPTDGIRIPVSKTYLSQIKKDLAEF